MSINRLSTRRGLSVRSLQSVEATTDEDVEIVDKILDSFAKLIVTMVNMTGVEFSCEMQQIIS
jgi:hypothetical protein